MPLRFTPRSMLDLARLATHDGRRGERDTVVHLLPTTGWGGAERLACTFHRLCMRAGMRSRIDMPATDALANAVEEETGAPDTTARHGDERTLRAWALGARRRIARERPSVVHAHLPFPDRFGLALLASRGRPLVATFQLLPEPGRTWSLDELVNVRSDAMLRSLARWRSRARYVAVSRADRATLEALLPPRRLELIANAPPLPRAKPRPSPPFVWPEGAVRLLSVGRLHAQKGFDRMLEALAARDLAPLAWHWAIAGDGPERAALASRAAELGLAARVSFDTASPASALYPTADLVLSPSRFEGMPLVPMEAVEADVPVVVSAIAAHRELLGGCAGAVLDDDPARWAPALARLVRDTAAREALLASERGALPMDPRAGMWETYAALYRAVAAE